MGTNLEVVWLSGNLLVSVSEVALCKAQLMLQLVILVIHNK